MERILFVDALHAYELLAKYVRNDDKLTQFYLRGCGGIGRRATFRT